MFSNDISLKIIINRKKYKWTANKFLIPILYLFTSVNFFLNLKIKENIFSVINFNSIKTLNPIESLIKNSFGLVKYLSLNNINKNKVVVNILKKNIITLFVVNSDKVSPDL